MLEQKDIEVLQSMMESVLGRRLEETTKGIEATMDRRLAESENLILEEMERSRGILDDKIERELESDNTALLLKMIEGLSKRVDKLERITA